MPEVREALTRQNAEEWAEASAEFAGKLNVEDLSLSEGVGVVQEWLQHARQLLGLMDSESPPTATPRTRAAKGGDAPADLLTLAQVAAKYAIGRSTVYAASRTGGLPHYRVPAKNGTRGKYLFRELDVAAWLESHRVDTPTPSPLVPTSSGSPGASFSELDPAKLARAWRG